MLGLAAGLDPALLLPFAESLRNTEYAGRTVFVTAAYSDEQRRVLSGYADLVHDVDHHYASPPAAAARVVSFIRARAPLQRAYATAFRLATMGPERSSLARWRRLEAHFEGLQALRYKHYYDVLRRIPDADQILLSDVRDVVFQGDPFEPPLEGLEVFLEEPSQRVGADPYNRAWIRHLYGEVVAKELSRHVISCSGTVAGPRAHVLRYLKEMIEAIVWRRRPLGPHDQGVHNFLLRTGALDPATEVRNGFGRVLTMGAMTAVKQDDGGRVLNQDGSIPAVLHQWDRHDALAHRLTREYRQHST